MRTLVLWLLPCLLSSRLILSAWTPIGSVTTNTPRSDGADFQLNSGAAARLQILDSRLAWIRITRSGLFSSRISPAIAPNGLIPVVPTITSTNDVMWFDAGDMRLAVHPDPFRIVAYFGDGSPMVADAPEAARWEGSSGQILVTKEAPADENYFGLGLTGGPINRKGRSFVMRNTDNSDYTEFTQPLYQSYPFYYGLRDGKAYGIFFDNPAFPFFDMDAQNQGRVLFGAETGELDYYIIAGPDTASVANTYGRLTGFNNLPPKWTLGYHHSRYGWKSEQEITNIATQLRQLNFPCDTLWFDIDYMDRFHQFTWNPATFPDPVGLHARLGQMGFHRVYISEPLLLQTDPLWATIDSLDYFLKRPSGQSYVDSIWFGDVSFVDFTRTVTRGWWKERLKNFLSSGIDGLWIDLNEPANNFMPDAIYNFDGDPRLDLEGRNLYASLHAQTAYDAQIESRTNTRPWNFSRGGYSGIQRYAHTWSGDPPSTFESLRAAIQISISMGLSGQNQFGHDTGGFLGSPNAELFTRWLEFSCFSPLFRNHSVNTALPREPWVFGEPYTATIRNVIRRRYEFLPYIYTLMEEASRTGRPVLAPTFFYAQGDMATYSQSSEYLFGPNLMVAPVYTEGSNSRTVYLPSGSDWTHFWTDQHFAGGQTVTVSAKLGEIPFFVRGGTILVRGGVMDYVGAPMDPALKVDVFPSTNSSFTLYEDEGNGFDYQRGAFLKTRIESRWTNSRKEISISRVEGNYIPAPRPWVFTIHNVANSPSGMALNGSLLPVASGQADLDAAQQGWFFDRGERLLVMKFNDSASSLLAEILDSSTIRLNVSIDSQGHPAIQFTRTPGTSYIVQYREDLVSSPWKELAQVPASPETAVVSIVDPGSPMVRERYYRVITSNP